MPTLSTAALPQSILKLLEQRQQHAAAIATIDATLARVSAALGATAPKSSQTPAAATKAGPVANGKKRQQPKKFAMSANESVLAFVKSNKNPTTQEIKQHWKSEGRGGDADNTLSILTKAKKLKRTPLGEGIRGSRYSVA